MTEKADEARVRALMRQILGALTSGSGAQVGESVTALLHVAATVIAASARADNLTGEQARHQFQEMSDAAASYLVDLMSADQDEERAVN